MKTFQTLQTSSCFNLSFFLLNSSILHFTRTTGDSNLDLSAHLPACTFLRATCLMFDRVYTFLKLSSKEFKLILKKSFVNSPGRMIISKYMIKHHTKNKISNIQIFCIFTYIMLLNEYSYFNY